MTVGRKRWRNVPRSRRRSKPDKTPVIALPNRLRKAGGTPVKVGEVCGFIAQTFTPTPGAPPLWLRLCRAVHLRHNVGRSGHFALQLHSGDELKIRFKDIELRRLRN